MHNLYKMQSTVLISNHRQQGETRDNSWTESRFSCDKSNEKKNSHSLSTNPLSLPNSVPHRGSRVGWLARLTTTTTQISVLFHLSLSLSLSLSFHLSLPPLSSSFFLSLDFSFLYICCTHTNSLSLPLSLSFLCLSVSYHFHRSVLRTHCTCYFLFVQLFSCAHSVSVTHCTCWFLLIQFNSYAHYCTRPTLRIRHWVAITGPLLLTYKQNVARNPTYYLFLFVLALFLHHHF